MQQEKFLELLSHPERLDKGSMDQLRQMAARFPYSQPIRILLAKNLQLQKNPDFERQVNQAAAYAFDRRHFQVYMSGRLKAETSVPAPAEPKKTEGKNNSPTPQPSWLARLFFKKKKVVVPPLISREVTPEATSDDANPKNETPAVELPENKLPLPLRKHDDLIDRFLKEEPRIKLRRDATPGENLAEKNLVNPEEIGTETLASVFIRQGLHEKALNIYQKLSLKFPEKSSYFAEKINSIKNEINLKK
jgi:hypothetical protein